MDTDGRAVASFAVGLVSLVLCYPCGVALGPIAVGLGVSSLRRLGRNPLQPGRRRATAGIVAGGVVTLAYIWWILIQLAAFTIFGSFIPAPN